MRALLLSALVTAAGIGLSSQAPPAHLLRFAFTSDAHYGLTRAAFRGHTDVSAHEVNSALVSDMKSLGALDFVVEGGDVANREEAAEGIQPASASWAQFRHDYIDELPTQVFVVPGNHDVSNAVGFYRRLTPPTDSASMVAIFNLMMAPQSRTVTTFDYAADRVLTSRTIGGVHFVFLTVWPDSMGRAWLARDLAGVSPSTPVVVFTHDQPEAQAKHFTNPNGAHDINATDKFENLLCDTFTDGRVDEWEAFLREHPNVVAYFHGNSNWNEFYDWRGPHHSVTLHTFRVDSPMKGRESERDETRLSFHVATIDTAALTLTVRERLWNAAAWGESTTVSLAPHAAR